MKIISQILFLLFFIISCTQKKDLTGVWQLEIKLQDQILPVLISLNNTAGVVTGEMYNSDEVLPLEGSLEGDKVDLDIATHYSKLSFRLESSTKISGEWIRTNKENYKVAFTGSKVKSQTKELFAAKKMLSHPLNIEGNWKVKLKEDKFGLGVFKQEGSFVKGSILSETGDYRYLQGYLEKNELFLYGFDGVFSFVFKLVIDAEKFKGTMYSGNTYQTEISAVKDLEFKLADANALTEVISDEPIKLKLKDILGKSVNFKSDEYLDKVKIIQLFGSWCPNCIDETHFFKKWRGENPAKLNHVKFIALAFERTSSQDEALKNLKKVSRKLEMDYPVVLVDFNQTVEVSSILPIKKVKAFPTTIFVGKDNKIFKIHTGFAGQATDIFFDKFVDDFNAAIDVMISDLP